MLNEANVAIPLFLLYFTCEASKILKNNPYVIAC